MVIAIGDCHKNTGSIPDGMSIRRGLRSVTVTRLERGVPVPGVRGFINPSGDSGQEDERQCPKRSSTLLRHSVSEDFRRSFWKRSLIE